MAESADVYHILSPLLLSLSALLTTPIASLKNPVHFPITSLKILSHVFPSLPSLSFLFSCTPIYIKYTAKSHSLDFLHIDIPTQTHPPSSLTLCRFVSHYVLFRNALLESFTFKNIPTSTHTLSTSSLQELTTVLKKRKSRSLLSSENISKETTWYLFLPMKFTSIMSGLFSVPPLIERLQ